MKASEIVIGDKFTNKFDNKIFKVVENHKDDVLFLLCTNSNTYYGYHLFYDEPEDIQFAKSGFNIDMHS